MRTGVYENGSLIYRDMTPEEEAENRRAQAESEAQEAERKRTNPTTEEMLNELLGVSV